MGQKFSVSAELRAEDKGASATVEKVEGRFVRFGKYLSDRFVITLGDVVNTFRSLVGAAQAVTDAASEQEDAVNRLNSALGDTAGAADLSREMQDLAGELQGVTRFGDEAIISTQALLRTMGVSAGQLGAATQATVDLAAAFNLDLESAARNVGKTVGGFAGELGELIPELKDLSATSLRAGKGIELLGDKFRGRAARDVETYSGALQQTKNTLGDLLETVGFSITQNEAFVATLQKLGAVLGSEGAATAASILGDALAFVAESTALVLTSTAQVIGSVGRFINRLTDATDAVEKYRLQLNQSSLDVDRSTEVHGEWEQELIKGRIALDLKNNASSEELKLVNEINKLTESQIFNLKRLTDSSLTLAEAKDLIVKASERELEIEARLAVLRGEAQEDLARVGIRTQTELAAALDKNAKSQARINDLLFQGEITTLRYNEITRDLADEQAGIVAVMNDAAVSVEAYRQSLDATEGATVGVVGASVDGTTAVRGFTAALVQARREAEQTTNVLRFTTASFDALASAQGRAAAVNAAIAAGGTLSQSGGRVNLVFGGSKLTSEFGFNSSNPVNQQSSVAPNLTTFVTF